MGSFSIWHWLVVLAVVLLFFGAGRLPNVMGDLAKGVKNFRAGLREGDRPEDPPAPDTPPVAAGKLSDPSANSSTAQRDETVRS